MCLSRSCYGCFAVINSDDDILSVHNRRREVFFFFFFSISSSFPAPPNFTHCKHTATTTQFTPYPAFLSPNSIDGHVSIFFCFLFLLLPPNFPPTSHPHNHKTPQHVATRICVRFPARSCEPDRTARQATVGNSPRWSTSRWSPSKL